MKAVLAATAIVVTIAGLVSAKELNDDQVENLVRRSYQYVAMYNRKVCGELPQQP